MPVMFRLQCFEGETKWCPQGWGEYQIYEYEYKYEYL